MKYDKNIETAIAFIETHLNAKFKTADVAKESAYSLFHFHRIFQAATGYTLKNYIRARRLTEAARQLVDTDEKIINISFDYGFESQEAFTRAFKQVFKTTPGKYRRGNSHHPSVYRNKCTINHLIHLNKGGRMTPKIIEKKGFKTVGLRYFGNNSENEIPVLWQEFMQRSHEIKHIGKQYHFFGLCTTATFEGSNNESMENMDFEYVAGADVTELKDIPEGMVGREVEDGKYAVFTHKGALSDLKETYNYIYGKWIQSGEYEIAGLYDFEFYNEKFDPSGSESSELYIYVPIK